MRYYLVLLLCLGFGLRSFAQGRLSPDTVLQRMKDSFPPQNVYIHLDRDRYLAGDTVWFKAYLRTIGFPGGNSTGLHVELFNDTGVCVRRMVLAVYKGRFSFGDMTLPDTLSQGRYTLRAYTDWMANFPPAFFYRHTFPVYGRKMGGQPDNTRATVADSNRAKQEAIRFFPEGGAAVDNVPGNIAFLATDAGGAPLQVRGKVTDDRDSTVARFKSGRDGMGVFELKPEKNRSYTAVVWTPYGERRLPLPGARPDGIALTIQPDARGAGFLIQADSQSRYIGRPLEVVASLHGQHLFRGTTTLPPNLPAARGYIPDTAGAGVLMVSVFAAGETEPLAERAVFIAPSTNTLPFDLRLDTLSTAPKGFNAWTLHFPDTTRGYFSVSVTDADALKAGDEPSDIRHGLLVDGDLDGYVYHMGPYLNDTTDAGRTALDLVMMTHAWRRLDWDALEEGRYPVLRYRDNKDYLTFRGTARVVSGNGPVGPGRITFYLEGVDSVVRLRSTAMDDRGNFTLDSLAFLDTASAYVLPGTAGGTTADLRLSLAPDTLIPMKLIHEPGPPDEDTAFVRQAEREDELTQANRTRSLGKGKELKEVVIKARKKTLIEVMDEKYAHGLFADQPGAYGFSLEDDKDALNQENIITYLMNKVPGLDISTASYLGEKSISYRNGHSPQFFLDEFPVNYQTIIRIHMADIAYVKFFQPPFVAAAANGGGGAIAIYTRRGFDSRTKGNGLNHLALTGYTRARPFMAPAYPAGDTAASQTPDYRVTLDWVPLLSTTDSTRSLPLRFYNNDLCRHFRIVVEGMDEEGRLLHFERIVDAGPGRAMTTAGNQ